MGPLKLRQNFPEAHLEELLRPLSWEAGSHSDCCEPSQKVLWHGPQAMTVALCDLSIPMLRVERHLLHSIPLALWASVPAVAVNPSEVTTSRLHQFSLFKLLGRVGCECHLVRTVDIHGRRACIYLAALRPLLPVCTHLSAVMKDPDAVLTGIQHQHRHFSISPQPGHSVLASPHALYFSPSLVLYLSLQQTSWSYTRDHVFSVTVFAGDVHTLQTQ